MKMDRRSLMMSRKASAFSMFYKLFVAITVFAAIAPRYGFWRPYVTDVIHRYLECGDLHFGFARVRCLDCGHEYLLAYSCKRRHFCPSCHQKRVVEFGEWLCTQGIRNPH